MFRKYLNLFFLLVSFGLFADAVKSCPPVPDKAVTPSARTCQGLNGAFISGDFLYWKARQEDLIYASFIEITQDRNTTVESLKPVEVDFEFDPGFKIGAGGDLPFDGWDLYLNWTHFHNSISSSVSSNEPNLVNFFTRQDLNQAAIFLGRGAKGSWNLMFNTLDFDWGRRFFLSETLTIRPSWGVKAAWINQRFQFKFSDVEQRLNPQNRFPDEFLHWKNKFWGIGPFIGINTKWTWGWGIGIYGELSGALLWGKFKEDQSFLINFFEEDANVFTQFRNSMKFDAYRIRPTIKLFVGLDWERCLIENWLSLNFRIGYEAQYFWSQVFNIQNENNTAGDLTLEGLTFTGRIDF